MAIQNELPFSLVDQAGTRARVSSADYDTGGGTVTQAMIGVAVPGSGGPVAGGTATNPLRTDPVGTTTQPVSGTVAATIADGADVALGATTDAAVTGDVVGTISAKLRGLSQILADVWDDANNSLRVGGAAAAGATAAGNPLPMAGVDGSSLVRTLLTDTSGRPAVVGAGAQGAALAGNPVRIAGSDGTLTQNLRVVLNSADGLTGLGFLGMGPYIFNATTWDRTRSAAAAAGSTGTGLLGTGPLNWDGAAFQRQLGDTTGTQLVTAHANAFTATPVLTVAGAYTAGDVFGTLIEVPNVARIAGGQVVIESITLTDASAQAGAFDVLIFGDNPTNSTFTDNSALSLNDLDLPALAAGGYVQIVASDYLGMTASSVAAISWTTAGSRLPLPVKCVGTSIWVVVVAQNTNSYADGDVVLRLKAVQD